MIEVIDCSSKLKLMAMIMGEVSYSGDRYIIYCIDRGKGDANIFVSKLVVSSDGDIFNSEFANGEKEVLDNLVKKIINKEDISKDGFEISNKSNFGDVNYFDIEKCYVATLKKDVIKSVMVNYNLVTNSIFNRPVVELKEDKRFFNEGFVGNIFFVVFGILVIIFCLVVLVGVFL